MAWKPAMAASRMQQVEAERHVGDEPGEPVVDEHEDDHARSAASDGEMPWRIESAPSDGPTVRSSSTCTGAGSGARPQHDGEVGAPPRW